MHLLHLTELSVHREICVRLSLISCCLDMSQPIKKAVFPVAGMGTRFLPATKASPKEMLPVVDKPLIQYAVEEAVAAGITDLVFVTGRNKRAIEDHFDKAYELETELELRENYVLLNELRSAVPANISCIYIRQAHARGLGHAVLCAAPVLGNEPFAVVLADDLIDAPEGALSQMVKEFSRSPESLVAVQTIERSQTGAFGIVDVGGASGAVGQIRHIVEKPDPSEAPSTLGVVGRYIFTTAILENLRRTPSGLNGEIQLTDGIARLMNDEVVNAFRFEGTRYDCGSKLGYLQAVVAFGLKHKDGGEAFRQYLRRISA